MSLKESVINALRRVEDPDLHKDLVTLNMVKDVTVSTGGDVRVVIELTTPACPLKGKIQADCEAAIRSVPGVGKITVDMTAEVRQGKAQAGRVAIPGVRNVVAVSSGKGGVGKSTTAVNLAVALKELGARVALLDADIYGPNIPGMIGASGRPKVIDNKMIPIEAYGIATMSMGYLVSEDQPLVWRGPMLHGVLKQLIHDVEWGTRDYLIIDLPPGTGDVQLSLVQMVPVAGAVIVTTPQNVALQDARKGIAMFQELKLPILGIVENMSFYLCPKCGHRDDIFSHQGGETWARKNNVEFLGGVPLNTHIREGMDRGVPAALEPESTFGAIYRQIAERMAQRVSVINATDSHKSPTAETTNPFAEAVKGG